MAVFVVDASVALASCFADEATTWTDGLLERLRQGDRIIVPAHWPTEVANALLLGVRRKLIKLGQPRLLWEEVARLPIETEPALTTPQAKDVLTLGERHGLTVYDAAPCRTRSECSECFGNVLALLGTTNVCLEGPHRMPVADLAGSQAVHQK